MNLDRPQPYLSIVVTARNDDHGGNMLGRLQTFVNALIAQGANHEVPLELVVVEWNPPAGKPKLAEVLRWPENFGTCSVRLIEVPPELHARQKHANILPLYQMIAKNAGIRRSRGSFILATNIDILFTDEFFQWLRQGAAQPGKMYRLDRYDVAADVPVDATVGERLAFCQSHLLRVNAREGTFPAGPDGLRDLAPEDIAPRGSEIFLGRGWHEPEQYFGRVFRWVSNEAEIILKPSSDRTGGFTLDLEPGPGTRGVGSRLQILDEAGQLLGEAKISRRTQFHAACAIASGQRRVLRLCVLDGGCRVTHDPRILNFRVFQCAWGAPGPSSNSAPAVGGRLRRGFGFLANLLRGRRPLRVGLPLSPETIERMQIEIGPSGVSFLVEPARHWFRGNPGRPPSKAMSARARDVGYDQPLHTNACGDFTMLAKDDWFDLRGYPEFDLFSLHIDSVFCFAAHFGGVREEMLTDPIRMYHIEHEIGTGATPEGQTEMFRRLEAKGLPWLEYAQVVALADQMRTLDAAMIFNRSCWGLADCVLPETTIGGNG